MTIGTLLRPTRVLDRVARLEGSGLANELNFPRHAREIRSRK